MVDVSAICALPALELARAVMREIHGMEVEPPALRSHWPFETMQVMRRRYRHAASRREAPEFLAGWMNVHGFGAETTHNTHIEIRGEDVVSMWGAPGHELSYLREALYLARRLAEAKVTRTNRASCRDVAEHPVSDRDTQTRPGCRHRAPLAP